MPDIVYPKTTGWISETVFVTEGEPWNADDPFVAKYPQHFSVAPGQSLRGSGRAGVEQATAAPGEKRDVTRTDAALDEAAALRVELTNRGVRVDNRWSLGTLREKKAELDDEETGDDEE